MKEVTWVDSRCTREGWPSGPWDGEPDKVQWKDEASGFVCLIKRQPRSGHLCGYVGVAPGHPWHGKGYEEIDAECHGGLTFANECQEGPPDQTVCHIPEPCEPDHLWWLGFDCAHCNDRSPMDEMLARDKGYPWTASPEEEYRTIAYVKEQCAQLAAQAAAVASRHEG